MIENDRETEMAIIEALDRDDLDDLIAEQAVQRRGDHGYRMPRFGEWTWPIAYLPAWSSVSAIEAERREMISETEIRRGGWAVPESELENLWEQAGREWHHIRHAPGEPVVRERFFRMVQVARFGLRPLPAGTWQPGF